MKSRLAIFFSLFLLNTIAFGQDHTLEHKDLTDSKPSKTDKILLKDGSEKSHIIKKDANEEKKASPPASGETKALPTDVD